MSHFVSQKNISCEAAAKIAQGAIDKANELGVTVLNEKQFIDLLG